MKKEEATRLIAEKMAEAKRILTECGQIADKAGVKFKFYPEDEASYGLARYPIYVGDGWQDPCEWRPINSEGWTPSSLDC